MAKLRPLFVYGSLKAGEAHEGLLLGLRRSQARVTGTLYRLPAGTPAMSLSGRADVHGELVHDPDPRVLMLIDTLRGDAFRRVEIEVRASLRVFRAWTWVMDRPQDRAGVPLQAGRWRSFRGAAR